MKQRFYILFLFITLVFTENVITAQNIHPLTAEDKTSLEGIIVEKYYTYDPSDKLDTTGGALPKGAVTYRIYVDLKPGYSLQAVYGVTDHQLFIKTTTEFYDNHENGRGSANYIDVANIVGNTAAFDSWLTMGAIGKSYLGILKSDDTDGSILKINSMNKADGLVAGKPKNITYFGIIPQAFNSDKDTNTFTTDNGSWAVFGGITGPTDDNKILIAQITTDGVLSFELNIQVGTPKGDNVNFVAKDPEDLEIKYDALTYKSNKN